MIEIKQSQLQASGGTSYGLRSTGTVKVDHCEVGGGSQSVLSGGITLLAGSRLTGTTSGTLCAGVYDQNLNFYTNTCP